MDAIAKLGQVFKDPSGGANFGNIFKAVTTGAGLIGNVMQQRQQQAALNKMLFYQKHPEAAAAEVRSLTQPLGAGLTQEVGNDVQGYLGERGLTQSPNITAQVLSQSLAPYAQQNQQQALNLFNQLINPGNATFGKPVDWASLLKIWQPAASVGTGNQPNLFPNIANAAISGAGITTDPGMTFGNLTPPPPPDMGGYV